MKVREIITIKGWEEGSGFSYEQTYSNQIKEITEEQMKGQIDWHWWIENTEEKSDENVDTKITVEYYAEDYDPLFDDEKPLASFSIWESEIWKTEEEKWN